MREIRFRITYQHEETGRFASRIIQLGDSIPNLGLRWIMVGKDQYIGTKDCRGKEICEGDILEIEGATAKVVFWERPPAFGLDYYHNEDNWCEDWNLTDDNDRMAIIGNRYENPELLNN